MRGSDRIKCWRASGGLDWAADRLLDCHLTAVIAACGHRPATGSITGSPMVTRSRPPGTQPSPVRASHEDRVSDGQLEWVSDRRGWAKRGYRRLRRDIWDKGALALPARFGPCTGSGQDCAAHDACWSSWADSDLIQSAEFALRARSVGLCLCARLW